MFKKGTKFEVVENGVVGVIGDSFYVGDFYRFYDVTFYENGRVYLRGSVYENTILDNLKSGFYKIIEEVK